MYRLDFDDDDDDDDDNDGIINELSGEKAFFKNKNQCRLCVMMHKFKN